jgi:hypothetical protein
VDNQKEASSEVKTHEEILRLFQDLESMEKKVKNPTEFEGHTIEPEAFVKEMELPTQNPTDSGEEPESIEPTGEIPLKKKEKKKISPLKKKEKQEKQSGKKISWFSFQKKETNTQSELIASTELEQQRQKVKIPQSTFTLQLDSDGHLVGLPIKKPKMESEKKGWFSLKRKTQPGSVEHQEEEPVKGIKGKLIQMVSRLRRKKSSEGESSSGIGDKIKGLFKRKSNE